VCRVMTSQHGVGEPR